MISPILALRHSIVSRFSSGLLKDIPLYDRVPSGVEGLYITFGDASVIDHSLHEAYRNYEVHFSLVVWSTPGEVFGERKNRSYGNAKRALEVGSRLIEVLHNAPLKLLEHELIFMRSVSEKLTRDISTGSTYVEIWFQAMTECRIPVSD